jgi:hypothetical protein
VIAKDVDRPKITETDYCPLTGCQPRNLRLFRPRPGSPLTGYDMIAELPKGTTVNEAQEALEIGKADRWVREADGRVTVWVRKGRP